MHFSQDEITSGTNISIWLDSMKVPIAYQPLNQHLECDVVIVGGGISGVSIAYKLTEMNRRVVLIEDGFLGSGETGRTSAHVVAALDDRYYNLERLLGKEQMIQVAESHLAAIDLIEERVNREKIDCDFQRVTGYLFRHPSDEKDVLEREYEACRKTNLSVELLSAIPGVKHGSAPCIAFHRQAQFHPLKYLKGLAEAVVTNGGKIYTGSHVTSIDSSGIETENKFTVKAEHVVVATNSPVNNKYVMHLKQYAYRTYCIGARIPKGNLSPALWWDTGDFNANKDIPPYHYVRTQHLDPSHDLLICGGEDHPTGIQSPENIPEEKRYAKLEEWCRFHFEIEDVIYKWSGQVMEPMDSLAFIGRNPMDKPNVYIVTGDSGNGMTYGTIASMLIPDLIAGYPSKWEKLYDPARFPIFKRGNVFFKEFLGGIKAYLKEYPDHPEDLDTVEIKAGDALIVKSDKKKYGAYVDSENTLHLIDAECTHLKCIVKWNSDEKTWDCPCHGSRFSFEGKILNGPAITPLSYLKF